MTNSVGSFSVFSVVFHHWARSPQKWADRAQYNTHSPVVAGVVLSCLPASHGHSEIKPFVFRHAAARIERCSSRSAVCDRLCVASADSVHRTDSCRILTLAAAQDTLSKGMVLLAFIPWDWRCLFAHALLMERFLSFTAVPFFMHAWKWLPGLC